THLTSRHRNEVRTRDPHLLTFLPLPRTPPTSPLFPYTTLFRSPARPRDTRDLPRAPHRRVCRLRTAHPPPRRPRRRRSRLRAVRSEEHTSELQSQSNLVCRLLLEKKKTQHRLPTNDS